MLKSTIRLHHHTSIHVQRAAKNAGVKPAALIRYTLERTFDGTPHNPLGVHASPVFYDALCDAIGVMCVSSLKLDKMQRMIAKKKAEEIRRELKIDYEF